MTADPRRRPFRNLQRRIRRRRAMTGESYMAAAAVVESEWERGQLYLSDPSVPAAVAAAVRKAGLLPLEALNVSSGWDWWCRCRWCDQVVDVRPAGHVRQVPGRGPSLLDAERHTAGRCTRPVPDPVVITPDPAMVRAVAGRPDDGQTRSLMALTQWWALQQRAPSEPGDPDAGQAT